MENSVEEIKSRLDIVDVLSGYIRLIPAGTANFKALCPFHNEKTPSLVVSREKQIWKCFGCNKGGDIFSFVMEMEGVEFKEALRILAGKAGVVLKRQDPKKTLKRNKILDCLSSASNFFYQVLLKSSNADKAREYLKNRQINDETIDYFKLGYAPASWDLLYKALRKKGFYENDIESAGLIIKKTNSFYDRFRNRIMFPLKDINGNVVGFSGRALSADDSAKYINTPQTDVFNKSKIIYGLEKAKQEIRKNDLAVVVEGQMDVISCHQAGFKNVVASGGTALTSEHIRILKRYSSNIALSFDTDSAGKAAARRAAELALQSEMTVKIIVIPEGKDPDECIRNNPENWKNAIDNSQLFLDYYFEKAISFYDTNKSEDKKKISKILLPLITKISDKIEQTHYLQKLARHLNVTEAILWEALSKNKKSNFRNENSTTADTAAPAKKNTALQISERIISLGLLYSENFAYITEHLLPNYIADEKLNNLYNQLIIYYTNNQGETSSFSQKFNLPNFKAFLNNEQLADYLDGLWMNGEKEILDYQEGGETISSQRITLEIKDGISRLKDASYKARLHELQLEIKKAEDMGDKEKIENLSRDVEKIIIEIGNSSKL